MPTGYTADIKKGITFKEYALGCARAFGACISLRDEPFDTPIPDKFEKSTYHQDALKEAKMNLERFQSYSEDALLALFKAEKAKDVSQSKKYLEEKIALKNKYLAMLKKVDKFVPPTKDHVAYKKFMQSQIKDSITFDCDLSYCRKSIREAKNMTLSKWSAARLASLVHDVEYHTRNQKEEDDRIASRNDWVGQLKTAISKIED